MGGIDGLRPHGYEKSQSQEVFSSNFLKVVRVRDVPSSNLGTPTNTSKETPNLRESFLIEPLQDTAPSFPGQEAIQEEPARFH